MMNRFRHPVIAFLTALGLVSAYVPSGLRSPRGVCRADAVHTEDVDGTQLPHIVLIVVDTLRADHLSQYGYPLATSPALEALASMSTRFTRAYSPSSWTVPSTASVHLGVHPARHRTIYRGAALNPKLDTLAEMLKAKGYETFGVSHNINVSRTTRYHQGFETFLDTRGTIGSYPDVSKMVAATTEWLAAREKEKRRRPFFLYLQPMNCHGPFKVPEESRSRLLSRPPAKGFKYYDRVMRRIMWRGLVLERQKIGEPYLTSLREQYDTAVRYTTDQLGLILGALQKSGRLDDSLVVLTSDHGEELFDHGGFTHGYTLYDEVGRVPLWIKMPNQRVSATSETLVSLMDIYPTVRELVGGTSRQSLDGLSLQPLFRGTQKGALADGGNASPPAVFDDRGLVTQIMWRPRGIIKALLRRQYKYIDIGKDYTRRGPYQQLFDLRKDPGEEKDLASADTARAESMREELKRRWTDYAKNAFERPPNVMKQLKEEALKALKALGYMQ
jgi:arylsulfatase A-like enzyme